MSRYIDADALKESVNGVSTHWLNDWSTLGILAMIDKQPTVDAVPVEQIEAFIDWLERKGYTLLKKAIIKALHDYRADAERKDDEH